MSKKIWIVGGVGVLLGAGIAIAVGQRVEPTSAPRAATGWKAVDVASGIMRPWGFTWLPDGRILVTEKEGSVAIIDRGNTKPVEVEGLPDVFSGGQGGLMDISIHPRFAQNNWVYMTLSTGSNQANRTVLVRGTWQNGRITGVREIFRVSQDKRGAQHFGSRLAWLADGTLLMSIGDGGNPPASLNGEFIRNNAQRPNSHIGKVLRLTEDGKAAPNNPFARQNGALPEVWSIGHRNIQGLVVDRQSGRIWANEHGARGGDEVNLLQPGKNYGWPVVTHSVEYSGQTISEKSTAPGMEDPKVVWTPCPAPSGLAIYTGTRFPNWRGDLFSGGLAGQDIRRVDLDAQGRVIGQERLPMRARIRDVRMGPDGFLYAITDEVDGRLIRIEPN